MTIPDPYIQHNTLETIRMGMRTHLDDMFLSTVTIEQAERALHALGQDVGFAFKKDIWADKIADDTITETQEVKTQLQVPTWNSAWQLWKANHAESKLFGWIARRWPPEKRGMETHTQTKTAALKFRVCKYHTFPDFNPETYPRQFGGYYRYIQQDRLAFNWTD